MTVRSRVYTTVCSKISWYAPAPPARRHPETGLSIQRQRDSFRIRKPQPHRQMASQNPILCDQVLVAEQQILIHQPRYERQEACPVESIAHGGTSIITTVGQRSSFARVFWLNGEECEEQPGEAPPNHETARDENVLRIYIVYAAETTSEISEPNLENGKAIG